MEHQHNVLVSGCTSFSKLPTDVTCLFLLVTESEGAESDVDVTDEDEMEITDDMLQFFAASAKHRHLRGKATFIRNVCVCVCKNGVCEVDRNFICF